MSDIVVTVTIDTRETAIADIISRNYKSDTINVQIAPLDLGDIVVEASNNVKLVFERKTGCDLAASIKDGRYREQKRRLLDAVAPMHTTYIVENKQSCTLPKAVFEGVVINTMYRDGIHVVYTANACETSDFVMSIANKVAIDPTKFSIGNKTSPKDYVDSVKVKSRKIDNIDAKTCYILQLGQIPGISSKIAREMANTYPNMVSLIDALQTSNTPIELLSSIPMIGTKKAKVIKDYLLGT